jgi:AhpD family alkylhydroperoxidase
MAASSNTALPRAGTLRAGTASLGVPQVVLGVWALFWPRGFFDSFPVVAGQHWLPAYGGYDSHLTTDVGATFLAIGALLLIAGWFGERLLIQVALVAYLVYAVPHFIFHLANDSVLSPGAQVVNGFLLGSSTLGAILLLGLSRLPGPGRPDLTAVAGSGSRLGPPPGGPLTLFGRIYARRRYGGDVRPLDAFAHHRKLATGYGALELALESSHRVPERLKALGELRASAVVGCEWCMDFGSHLARRGDWLSEHEIQELARYQESDAFSDLDKLVLDYATAMSRTPAEVGEELFAGLRAELDDAQIVELTSAIATENFRARFNHAVGIEPQGFSEGAACVVPALADQAAA